ncbi:MAG: hypothetical protein ACO3EZ_14290 [Prochlorotrichaceae cyanobacterium]
MLYSSFSLKQVRQTFHLKTLEQGGIFAAVAERDISALLQETLADHLDLAIAINTEKARSELLIAPVLTEIRRIFHKQISLFSGIELTSDRELNLTGFCDFLISQSPEQLFLTAPVITIVEAKNENLMTGVGQCAAEMVAAQRFNAAEERSIAKIYGVITSGTQWRFLRLEGQQLAIDLEEYSIKEIRKIVGILCSMVEQTA